MWWSRFEIAPCTKGHEWTSFDTPNRFRAFIERRHVNIPLAFDHDAKVHDSFGLHGVPALVVLDREGRVRLTRMGYNSAETSFHRDLVQFLKSL